MSTNNSKSNDELEALLDRVKEWIGEKKDADVARALDVSRSSISTWRARGTVPYGELVQWAYRNDVSLDWLFYGGPEDATAGSPLDLELLAICIEAAEIQMKKRGLELPAPKKSQLICMIYDLYDTQEKPEISEAKIIRLIDLAS